MSQFNKFSAAVAARFAAMVAHGELYRLDVPADDLWDAYLASFPAGTNEIFRERTEHDGSYDRSFIKRIGNVVSINPVTGEKLSLWADLQDVPFPYDVVAEELWSLISDAKITSLFRTKETNAGHKPNFELIDGKQHEWTHFYVDLPKFAISKDAGADIGQRNTNVGVMKRGLEEIKPEAIADVLELIQQKTLYRGDEFEQNLRHFQKGQNLYLKNNEHVRNSLLWLNSADNRLLIRNSVIGTLLTDLSEGMPLEQAVKAYETKVAPANYKRPTALITPAMVQNAMTKINDLGLEPSLYRRHARLSDININDVLWADASAKNIMAGSIGDVLMQAAVKKAPSADKAVEISIEDFMSSVVPKASTMELFVSNKLRQKFVNITAPEVKDSAPLFKWDNPFAWSYHGNQADSFMRQEVQNRGGSVTGDFRFTHSWNHPGRRNGSLMDLHVFMPGNTKANWRAGDNYGNDQRVGWNHRGHTRSGGRQDVDYTQIAPVGFIPVENITFPDLSKMPDGVYECAVHNWSLRSPTEAGFMAEIEFNGNVYEYDYPKKLGQKEWVHVASVTKLDGQFVDIKHHIPCGSASQRINGITTESFVRVSTLMLSPNYWGDQAIGNKHHIFLLEGAQTDENVRGIYNEFLRPELEEHRKVFEVLGAKTVVKPEGEQLAGLGFSSTIRAEAIIKVAGPSINQTYLVKF